MSKEMTKRPHTHASQTRRRFLESTVLAAAGGAAAVATSGDTEAASASSAPATCPTVPTPMKDVAGKVAFVTGGNSGIGLGIARAFFDAGMKVVITYRSKSHLDEALGFFKSDSARVHAVSLDVTDRAGMETAAAETVKKFGKVHVLVNNAGVGVQGPLSAATYDDWDWGIGVNLNGVFNGIRTFLPRIREHGEGGHIISTSSLAGLIAHGGLGVYTASKFAVVGMMEALRFELAETNIGVSAFCPGIVNTNIASSERNRPESLRDSGAKVDPEMLKRRQEAMRQAGNFTPPGLDPLDVGQRVLRGMRNNDMYILTTPEFEPDFRARGDAITASLPTDLAPSQARENFGRMIVGKMTYASERDRKLCERQRKA